MYSTKSVNGIACAVLSIFILSSNISFAAKNANEAASSKSKQELRQKLKNTVIDRLEFFDTKVSKAVKILSERFKINIILKQTPQQKENEAIIDLLLVKKNLYEAIYYLCKSAGLKFKVGKNAVIISYKSKPFTSTSRNAQLVEVEKKINLRAEKKLEKIYFKNVKLTNVGIFPVIKFINRYSKRNDHENLGISVIAGFDMKTARKLPKITMKYANVSMKELLRQLCQDTGLMYKVKSGAIILLPNSTENKKVL